MLERLGGGVERTCVLAAGEREMFDGMPNPDDRHGASPSHAGGVLTAPIGPSCLDCIGGRRMMQWVLVLAPYAGAAPPHPKLDSGRRAGMVQYRFSPWFNIGSIRLGALCDCAAWVNGHFLGQIKSLTTLQ
jgi:hypothetical protein